MALRSNRHLPGATRKGGKGFQGERQASEKGQGTAGHVGKTPSTSGLMDRQVPGLETTGRCAWK